MILHQIQILHINTTQTYTLNLFSVLCLLHSNIKLLFDQIINLFLL